MKERKNNLLGAKERFLLGKRALVTGSIRGIGKEIAEALAKEGAEIVLNYRDPQKERRAKGVEEEIQKAGVRTHLVRADIVTENKVLINYVQESLGKFDILVLNAAGGLEQGEDEVTRRREAEKINVEAQLELTNGILPLINPGGVIVYITSHWAHRFEEMEVPKWYKLVAETKHRCEKELLSMRAKLAEKQVKLLIVSGPLTQDTGAYRLLEFSLGRSSEPMKKLESESIKVENWGEILRRTLRNGFESGDVVYVEENFRAGF